MTKLYRTFCDRLWVLQAFIRGKWLRQKDYIPGSNPQAFVYSLLKPSWAISNHSRYIGRLASLMKWWGPQLLTMRQIHELELMATWHKKFGRIPFLFQDPDMSEWDRYNGVSDPQWIESKEMLELSSRMRKLKSRLDHMS